MYVVTKTVDGREYLYVHEAKYDKTIGRSRSHHVAYLGRKEKLTNKDISMALQHYGNKTTRKRKWKR